MRGAEHIGDWLVWVTHQIRTSPEAMRIEYRSVGEHGTEIEISLGDQTSRLEIQAILEDGRPVLRAKSS